MPLYAFKWPGWIKLGFSADIGQRAADGFCDNSHPPELCNRLTFEHFSPLGAWEANEEDEKELHKQFNEGVLRRCDNANEFYLETEWPKIQRELDTCFPRLALPEVWPPPNKVKSIRACCRGWKHWCGDCGMMFANNSNRKRHLANPPPSCVAAKRAKNVPQD